jgi:signal transduction histidine kinase
MPAMNSSVLIECTGYTLHAATYGDQSADLTPTPDAALPFVRGMAALVACSDLPELASQSARLLEELFGVSDVFVLLRATEKDYLGFREQTSPALQAWADELLSAGPPAVARRDERSIAARIGTPEMGVGGLVAVVLTEPDLDAAQLRLLEAVASLIARCGARLTDIRAAMARGLHDLCTPLNTLRLGLQLLEPGLSAQDPAVAQRVHRAIERMGKLVEGMFTALEPR